MTTLADQNSKLNTEKSNKSHKPVFVEAKPVFKIKLKVWPFHDKKEKEAASPTQQPALPMVRSKYFAAFE